ncbi:MAG: GatB/YqeY domain-containing protein [Geminicoccaceae bacterium]|nr:GatB/YqeY domain-containing protein [Geminicoccaceae bacterium]
MLRSRLSEALREAAESGDERAHSTLRLVLAALKERDTCARLAGVEDGLDDAQIRELIVDMINQRKEQIERCESKARLDLAEQEAEEIGVLEHFIPAQMSVEEMDAAVSEVISDLGASRLKDMGRVMAALHERYEGQMDFALAKRQTCRLLS